MADDDLPPDADAIYGLPLEDFVPERAAVAKRLRGEGDRETAKRVTALRKPSVAAWTINQLVRSRAKDVAAFTKAADGLRAAQGALLEGHGSPADLRTAREAERKAVGRLIEVARGLFPGGREPGESTLERIGATLHAAAADEAIRDEVLSGRLLRERESSGFGDLDVELAAAVPPKPRRKRRARGRRRRGPRAEARRPPRGRPPSASAGRVARPCRRRSTRPSRSAGGPRTRSTRPAPRKRGGARRSRRRTEAMCSGGPLGESSGAMDTLRGALLVAAPTLLDPNFQRTVVLVTEHTDEGAMGLVLNRPTDTTVADAAPELEALTGPDELVHQGGPVQPRAVVVLAEFADPGDAAHVVMGDIGFVRADADLERAGIETRRGRVYAGYAGWGPGQLEGELEDEGWIVVAHPLADELFSPGPDDLWHDVLERQGGQLALVARMPLDPSLN